MSRRKRVRILIAGGGTGGHLFPGIALAEAFKKKDPANEIQFVVTIRPLDSRVLTERGYPFKTLKMEGIKGKGIAGKIRTLFRLPRVMTQSKNIIKTFSPDLVLGVGGYVSGPVVLAAWWKGLPCAVQEQNSIPGLTNRWLGYVVDRVFGAFRENEAYFPKGKLRITGNPLRQEMKGTTGNEGSLSRPLTLLIIGGSQGAHRINQTVIEALDALTPWRGDLNFIHQTGENDEKAVALAYGQKGFAAQSRPFISDMVQAYLQADVIISRAGAMSVSEITAMGKPSLLIPFPYAANNHQEFNARALVSAGAAEMVLEKDLTPALLADRIREWLGNREVLMEMGRKAGELAHPGTAEEIVNGCYQMVAEKKSTGSAAARII
jgi:UDP-N-acetylglucosamine--N-acetylmuramyl-(pentapeptide) pyrophosphoryl-undecaprenol N-acetylglucosamine transferase